MSYERFVEHHRDRHAPLFTSIPEAQRYVRKYTVSHPVPAENYPPRAYDGLEIWFEAWADHDAFFASENYRTAGQPRRTPLHRHGLGGRDGHRGEEGHLTDEINRSAS
ncbi:EthD domain-containing protein [Streptomyces sp. ICBB 8177]|uniref:EthD domain-containing protein n=1 Tax=Streptomyces sp. ICBB 8177 TaxID=563922 RepID=UPI001F54646A|nr:EthD domain-containing protein [Streptomyces sp. ICBB 8177]